MERLSYQTLERQGYSGYLTPREAPVRVVQFGEGNFMRAFVDAWIDLMNERGGFDGRVQLVSPIAPGPGFRTDRALEEQEGLYTLYLQGQEGGRRVRRKRVISCVSGCLNPYEDFAGFLALARIPTVRFVASNTTEAGIAYDPDSRYGQQPPASYPAKLCRFLHERWQAGLPGVVILACELIDRNGQALRDIVLRHCREWRLEEAFARWLEEENLFCSTLVDRIVPGYPRAEAEALTAENGYEDRVMDTGEVFGFWVIEGPQSLLEELPIREAGLEDHILVVDDHTPYKQRKVRILNGAHTAFVPGAFLAGRDIVRDCMEDPVIRDFMEVCIYQEIIPTLTLPRQELLDFAASVADRFQNPYIDHQLLSICLNSTSKWRARVLPSVKGYWAATGRLPRCLTASFALYLAFCRRGETLRDRALVGRRAGVEFLIQDDLPVLEFFLAHRGDSPEELARAVCANQAFWGEDLTRLPGFAQAAGACLADVEQRGAYAVMADCRKGEREHD